MASNAWTFYDKFFEQMGEEIHNLETDAIKMALFLSASNCQTTSLTDYSQLTNEHAQQYGYTTGGVALTGPVISESGGVTTFDCTGDAQWTASGGSMVARFAVVYNSTAPSNDLICWTIMDNTPSDVTVTDGNTLTIQLHASGIFTITVS
jgi:hypothetical protein